MTVAPFVCCTVPPHSVVTCRRPAIEEAEYLDPVLSASALKNRYMNLSAMKFLSKWTARSNLLWNFSFLFAFTIRTCFLSSCSSFSAASELEINVETTNIHAMIVSSSRYWFNYRHAMNALGMYEIFRQNGIPDENIILMIADEYATNARNPYKNRMHASGVYRPSWYSNHTELDYRGSDVTVQTFMDSLLGLAPRSLRTDSESNLLIYVTGHGGDQFFKFQDEEELTAQDIANLMERLYQEGKFKQALFLADTCQAFTLFDKVITPNVLALGTSLRGENAYAHHVRAAGSCRS
jgi:glycosylphosphatidylinositol transamidase (GPIT) subunit GPI8